MSFELEANCNSIFDFSNSARSVISVSDLMNNRVKISSQELIDIFPDGVTFNRFDIVCGKNNKPYPIFTIKEDDSVFYSGGSILKKIVDEWLSKFNGNLAACKKHFEASNGFKVKLSFATSKSSGFQYVKVSIL